MKSNLNLFISIVIYVLYSSIAIAQEQGSTHYGVEILVQSNKNDVAIRWAPTAKETWVMGNVSGYVLERKRHDGKGWQLLKNVQPYTLAEWKSKTDTTNVNNAIAAQCLLGKRKAQLSTNGGFSQYLTAAQEGDNKYVYALMAAEFSQEAATGLGLFYRDKDIKKGEVIEYRVYVKHIDKPFSGDTARIRVYTSYNYEPQKVTNVTVEPQDGKITLYWNRPLNSAYFSGYYIEKSIDKGKTFKRLNERPYIKSLKEGEEENRNYSFIDTNVINYKPYRYRIIGITPFGEEGLPSSPILTEGIDLTGPIPPSMIYVTEMDEPGKFQITWDATTNAPDHDGFYVAKSPSATGPFDKLTEKPLSKSTRSFLDEEPSSYSSIYYVVFATDDKGNENMSVVQVGIKTDSIPPAQPLGLSGNVDSAGVVMLAWEMNTETDLQGYRVYRGNRTNHEFIQLTSDAVPGNFYFDTISLRTLTNDIFYKVVAIDKHYNSSPYSEPIKIRKPDFIAPQSPTFTNYKMSSTGVKLQWKVSPSDDAIYQVLYRKQEGAGWTIIQEFANNTDTLFVDSLVERNAFYTYTVVTIDSAGLYSEKAHPLKIKVADDGVRPGVTSFIGEFDTDCKCFRVSWEFESAEDYHYVIFRDENNTGLQAVGNLGKDEKTYEDTNIFAYENGYKYQIKVVYENGGESLLSEPVQFLKGN